MLDLTNTISTFDALNTQEKTIEAIVKQHGNYVAAVKGNQGNLYKDIKQYFGDKECYKEAKEDANLTMNKQAQANLNILRKLCLNLLKLIKPLYNKSLKLIRFKLGQDFENEIVKVLLCLNIEVLKDKIAEMQ